MTLRFRMVAHENEGDARPVGRAIDVEGFDAEQCLQVGDVLGRRHAVVADEPAALANKPIAAGVRRGLELRPRRLLLAAQLIGETKGLGVEFRTVEAGGGQAGTTLVHQDHLARPHPRLTTDFV
jgi:hypothetical protein